jgi:aminomethyltransferase
MGRYVDVDLDPDYIGKAALQKVAAEGPRRLFTGLVLEGDAPSAWPLVERVPVRQDGEHVGTMSTVVHSHRLQRTIGLAQIRRDLVEANATVEVDSPNGVHRAEIHALPFL